MKNLCKLIQNLRRVLNLIKLALKEYFKLLNTKTVLHECFDS